MLHNFIEMFAVLLFLLQMEICNNNTLPNKTINVHGLQIVKKHKLCIYFKEII